MKLPSRLTSFEQFLFFDDYPAYPNTISCRLNLCGGLDEGLLNAAVEVACEKNVMMKALLERRWRGPTWVRCLHQPTIERLPDEFVDRPYIRKIDLDRESGGQMHWAASGDRSSLNFLTHHAAADGIGGLQVVADWLQAYHAMATRSKGGAAVKSLDNFRAVGRQHVRQSDPRLLDRRGKYGFWRWRFLKTLPRQMIGLFGVHEFLVNRPVPLLDQPHGPVDQALPEDYPGVMSQTLAEVGSLRSQAGLEQVTVNDLILQCIFQAAARWRRKHGYGTDDDLLRLMVPINLRQMSDRRLPAANRSSIVTLDRVQAKCLDDKDFLQTIRFQMNVIKANELGYTFLHVLNLANWFPRGVRRFANPERIGATILVTNLGEPFKRLKVPRAPDGGLIVGDSRVDSFDLIAPLRPNTQAAFAIYRYAGRTILSLTYDNRVVTESSAKELLELVCTAFQRKAQNLQVDSE